MAYTLTTTGSGGTSSGDLYLIPCKAGVVGIAVTAPPGTPGLSRTIEQIIASATVAG